MNLRGLPEAYWVSLTDPDSYRWAQMVYQAGHEYTHVWLDPTIDENWFDESVCIAVSHVALEEMAREWKTHHDKRFADYAADFVGYEAATTKDYLKTAGLASEAEVEAWIKNNLPRINRESGGRIDRNTQHLCSLIIKRKLERYPDLWRALMALGPAIKGVTIDFSRWRNSVPEQQRPLVIDLAAFFEPLLAPGQ